MKAHSSKLNGMRLPCPRCHNPASIEARVCSCGYRFVADPLPRVKHQMPELKEVIPGFQPIVHKIPIKQDRKVFSGHPGNGGKNIVYLKPETHALGKSERKDIVADNVVEEPPTDDRYIDSILPLAGLTTITSQSLSDDGWLNFKRGLKYLILTIIAVGIIGVVGGIIAVDKQTLQGFVDSPSAAFQTPIPVEPVRVDETVKPDPQSEPERIAIDEHTSEQQTFRSEKNGTGQKLSEGTSGDPQVVERDTRVEPDNLNGTSTADLPRNTATAKARCGDGTYSYRDSRNGVCSYRGGVAEWLDGSGDVASKTSELSRGKKTADARPDDPSRKFILGARGGCYYLGSTGSKNYVDKSFCN